MGAGAFVVILVVIFTVIFFMNRHRAVVALKLKEDQMDRAVIQAESACETKKDSAACKASVRAELAQKAGNPDYCKSLLGDDYDTCVRFSVFGSHNTQDCHLIQNASIRTSCLDTQAIVDAAASSDVTSCEAIADANQKERCISSWTLDQLLVGNCEPAQITDELCAISASLRAAIEAKNPDLCADVLDVHYQSICAELTLPGDRDYDGLDENKERQLGTSDTLTDSDADGLSDADEVNKYATNPAVADSDKDGYTDGVEIKSGHNPLGKG